MKQSAILLSIIVIVVVALAGWFGSISSARAETAQIFRRLSRVETKVDMVIERQGIIIQRVKAVEEPK